MNNIYFKIHKDIQYKIRKQKKNKKFNVYFMTKNNINV